MMAFSTLNPFSPRFSRHIFLLFVFPAFLLDAAFATGTIHLRAGAIDPGQEPRADVLELGRSIRPCGQALALIRFAGPIRPEWIESAKGLGVNFHYYIPDFSYLASIHPGILADLEKLDFVEWIGHYPATARLHPLLKEKMASGLKEIEAVILSVDDSSGPALSALGIPARTARKSIVGWHETRARLQVSRIEDVAQLPGVFLIEPEIEIEMQGERAAQTAAGNYLPGGTAPIGPGYMDWLTGHGLAGGSGLTVQVMDDGLDRGQGSIGSNAHADFRFRIVGVFNATSDPGGESLLGHGTINAGIIAGNATVGTRDRDGFLLGQGLAPQARIFGTKVFNNTGLWDTQDYTHAYLATLAQEVACTFSSNSWSSHINGEYTSLSAEYDSLTRNCNPGLPGNQPMIFFFAAGNRYQNGSIGAPATAKNVISVGATKNSDADGRDGCGLGPDQANNIRDLAVFTSRGPTRDGRFGISVVAVGTHVQGPASTCTGYNGALVCDRYWPDGQTDYARSSGTSHSTPVACGAGMVAFELFQTYLAGLGTGHPANPSPALIKAVLAATAQDLADGSDGRGELIGHAPNPKQGFGTVNLSNLLDMKDSLHSFDQEHLFTSSGQSWSTTIRVADPSKPLKIVLTWTDVPAMPAAEVTLVNDLDLVVEGENGTLLGNVFHKGFSVQGGQPDRRNNVEAVFIENPGILYEIRVNAHNIAGQGVPGQGSPVNQDFALFAWNGHAVSERGSVFFGRRGTNCRDQLEVHVADAGLRGANNSEILVTSSSGDSETLTLAETIPQSGFLTGILHTTSESSPSGDGILRVHHRGIITATYQDADDGGGSQATATDTIPVDCIPPEIIQFGVSDVSSQAATFSLQTDKETRAIFHVGHVEGEPLASRNSPTATSHNIRFENLLSCASHAYWASVEDSAGNVVLTNTAGDTHRFTTRAFFQTFTDLFDPVPGIGWYHYAIAGTDAWHPTLSEYAHSGSVVFAHQPGVPYFSDAYLVTPQFSGGGVFTFWHTYEFTWKEDGGILEISTDNGNSWRDLEPYIQSGGYNGQISSNYDTPINGRNAWTGGKFGPMTRVQVDLGSFSVPVRIAFRATSSNRPWGAPGNPSPGWQIDSILSGIDGDCKSAGVMLSY